MQSRLDSLHGQIANIASSVDDFNHYSADTAESVRLLLGMAGTEVTDCPRLFTLTPKPAKHIQRFIPYKREYRLMLWCEHPGCLHPWSPASYEYRLLRDWLANIAEYAVLVFKALRVAVPVALAADTIISPELMKQASQEIKLMESLVENSPTQLAQTTMKRRHLMMPKAYSNPCGSARAFRAFMFRRDPYQVFGGLRRYIGPSGNRFGYAPRTLESMIRAS